MSLEEAIRTQYRRRVPPRRREQLRWLLVNLIPALRSAPADFARRRAGGFAVPGARLRSRVGRDCSRSSFLDDGRRVADSVISALSAAGLADPRARRWIDFGCGSGRVARQLLERYSPAEFVGLDTDADAVRWCARHLPGRYAVLAPRPPAPVADASAEIVLAISVFSHLDQEPASAWLGEIRRWLTPGGLLLASTHSERLTFEIPTLTPDDHERLRSSGFLFVPGAGRFNASSAFHSRAFLEAEWGRELTLEYFAAGGLAGYQDVSVWRLADRVDSKRGLS